MFQSSATKLIITSCVFLVFIGALCAGYLFMAANVRGYRETIAQTMTSVSAAEKDFDRITKISDLFKKRETDIARLKHLAVDHKRPLIFIETVEQIGRTTGTKMSLSVNETDPDFLLFGTTVEGSLADIRAALGLILVLPYQIHIDSISFQRDTSRFLNQDQAPGASAPTRLVLTMRVKTQ